MRRYGAKSIEMRSPKEDEPNVKLYPRFPIEHRIMLDLLSRRLLSVGLAARLSEEHENFAEVFECYRLQDPHLALWMVHPTEEGVLQVCELPSGKGWEADKIGEVADLVLEVEQGARDLS